MADMETIYVRINWENSPSSATALGATNLNKMDLALSTIDGRVVTINTTKLDLSTANTMVQNVTVNEQGVFTITKLDGTTTTYDTKIEKIAVNFEYDEETQRLVLTLEDGTIQYVDLSSLVTDLDFTDSDTIDFTVTNGIVSAIVKNGSITGEKLQPNYLADVTVQAQNASNSASSALTSANNADISEANALLYSQQALDYKNQAQQISGLDTILNDTTPSVNTTYSSTKIETIKSELNYDLKYQVKEATGALISETTVNGSVLPKQINGKSTQASTPTPDAPVVINSLGTLNGTKYEFDIVENGKNWFDGIIEQGAITSAGTLTDSTIRVRSKNYIFLLNGTYRISFSGADEYKINIFKLDGTHVSETIYSAQSVLINITQVCKIKISFKYSTNVNITPSNVTNAQLEIGTVATAYEAYKGNKFTISLDDQLRTNDKIYRDGSKFYLYKGRKKIVLNGTENILLESTGTNTLQFITTNFLTDASNDSKGATLLSSHFSQVVSIHTTDIEGIGYTVASNGLRIRINKSRLSTQDVAGFKTWLASNNVTINYDIATPVITELDANNTYKLLSLVAYDGTTNIYVNSELNPSLVVEVPKTSAAGYALKAICDADRPLYQLSATLLASGWTGSSAPYTNTITDTKIGNENVGLDLNVPTTAQVNAFDLARLKGAGTSNNVATFKAYGVKPAIDIPVLLLIGGK